MDALNEALAALSGGLAGRHWFVFGAQAVRLWGTPRQTLDIDITLAMAPSDVDELVAALALQGFQARPEDPREFAQRYWVLPMLHTNGTPIDIVLAGTPFEHEALARSRRMMLYGIEVPVVTPEDLIVYKLGSDRTKDYEDAMSVIRRQAQTLDTQLVRTKLRDVERAHDRSDLVSAFERQLASARRA